MAAGDQQKGNAPLGAVVDPATVRHCRAPIDDAFARGAILLADGEARQGGLMPARIRHALDELERVQTDIGRVVSRTDDRKRHDLIDCRRRLAVQITEVNHLAEQWLAELARPDLLQAYRDHFSKMRSASAMHQASWPAVRLTEKTPEYEASAATLRSANHEFIHWVRATLDQF